MASSGDGPLIYQSKHAERHHRVAQALADNGQAYPCGCSRKDLADAERGPLGIIYPGKCRSGCSAKETALRVRTNEQPITFEDRLQGPQSCILDAESGDFIVRRKDGLIAYHLAVVIDDADEGVTDVVRGVDLLPSTPLHLYLQRLLGLPSPRYAPRSRRGTPRRQQTEQANRRLTPAGGQRRARPARSARRARTSATRNALSAPR